MTEQNFNNMIIYKICSDKKKTKLLIIYWAGILIAFLFNMVTGRYSTNYVIWLALVLLPLVSKTITSVCLLSDCVKVNYSIAGFIPKTRSFTLRTSVFAWKKVTSFRGGTHSFLICSSDSTMRVGAIDGFEISELEMFYQHLRKAQENLISSGI